MHWVEQTPLPLVGLALFVSLVIVHEIALRVVRRLNAEVVSGHALGYLVSSALALLGLLMAFTFSAAESRYMLRQRLVVSEANAIVTTYLRLQLLDQPWRDRMSSDLIRYTEARLHFTSAKTPDDVERATQQTLALRDAIWADLNGVVTRTDTGVGVKLGLMNTINDTFDQAASARAARDARVPITILRALWFCSLTVAAIVGFAEARDRRWTGVLMGVLLLLSLAFCLILDLDRPTSGTVRVSDAPLQRALVDLRRGEAVKRQAPPQTAASP